MRFSESVSARLEDGVLVVTIDNPPVNALSADVRAGLMAALDHAGGSDDITGVVITGAGRGLFDHRPEPSYSDGQRHGEGRQDADRHAHHEQRHAGHGHRLDVVPRGDCHRRSHRADVRPDGG